MSEQIRAANLEFSSVRVCADCTTFPVHFRSQNRWCPTKQKSVGFFTHACERQRERRRAASLDLIGDKYYVARERLDVLSRLLNKAWGNRRRIERERIAREETERAESARVLAEKIDKRRKTRAEDGGSKVYFIQCGPYTKIGFTRNPVRERLTSLMTANPFDMKVWAIVPTTSHFLEGDFHRWLAKYRHRCEWFLFGDDGTAEARRLIIEQGGILFDE